ncbi:MAG: hypothetical protein HFH48_07120 [Lachnospiraceae bacterium]|nr:hypothetical protein [Lachnospiraceae bacterium]
MSEFHRMITYLYLYEQDIKRHNVGFAKIEKRDQQCLVEIHMKNTGHSASLIPVYFYAQNQQQFPGISLGTMGLSRGNGDFKTILKGERLADSGYTLDDVKGIYIPLSQQIMFVSQWDDTDFVREHFLETAKKEENLTKAAPEQSPPEAGVSSQPKILEAEVFNPKLPVSKTSGPKISDAGIPGANGSGAENPNANGFRAENSSTQTSGTENSSAKDSGAAIPGTADSGARNSNTENPGARNSDAAGSSTKTSGARGTKSGEGEISVIPVLKAAEAAPKFSENTHWKSSARPPLGVPPQSEPKHLPENWNLKWEFILENYPVMTPFANDEDTLCVRLELRDIRLLPKQYWYLGNNSFLLHGFFNYRYLILGMTEKAGKKRWFIGIPGVFQNPERVMASLFGFPEFRNEKSLPINTGEFGYWYRYLNE